jgi:putative PIG3 family NAD(P)H quinone oxidoreductase
MAGEVAETGPGVQKWKVGDAVCSLLGGGGYAEYAVIPENMALPVLPGWSWAQAASVPEAFLTAWQSLHWIGALKSGERVLIHAGASGVGTAAIQLAKALGAEPWVTASASKHDLCRQLGAAGCIDYRTEDFSALLDAARPHGGVDVLIDCIGAPYLHKNLQVLRSDGRMILLAMMGGAVAESLDLRLVLGKRLNLHGSTLRNRDRAYKERLVQDLYTFAWPRFAEGTLHPVLDCTFPLEEVAQAHRYMEENRNTGKIALLL